MGTISVRMGRISGFTSNRADPVPGAEFTGKTFTGNVRHLEPVSIGSDDGWTELPLEDEPAEAIDAFATKRFRCTRAGITCDGQLGVSDMAGKVKQSKKKSKAKRKCAKHAKKKAKLAKPTKAKAKGAAKENEQDEGKESEKSRQDQSLDPPRLPLKGRWGCQLRINN